MLNMMVDEKCRIHNCLMWGLVKQVNHSYILNVGKFKKLNAQLKQRLYTVWFNLHKGQKQAKLQINTYVIHKNL